MNNKPYKIIDDGNYGVPDDESPEWTEQDFKNARPLSELLAEVSAKHNQQNKKPSKHKKAA